MRLCFTIVFHVLYAYALASVFGIKLFTYLLTSSKISLLSTMEHSQLATVKKLCNITLEAYLTLALLCLKNWRNFGMRTLRGRSRASESNSSAESSQIFCRAPNAPCIYHQHHLTSAPLKLLFPSSEARRQEQEKTIMLTKIISGHSISSNFQIDIHNGTIN